MTATLTEASQATEALASQTPTRADGTLHRYELIYAGGTQRAYADELHTLLGALIPGYAHMSELERWEARLHYATRAQVITQAVLNTHDAFRHTPLAQKAILQGSRHTPPVVATWDCPIPLVLITSYYEPAGINPRPVSDQGMPPNVVWIDPSDDEAFLTTLHDLGVIALYVSG